MLRLTFLGAAKTVTGSKYLVKTGTTRVLVDCGLFQGLASLRQRNWNPLPVEPSSIDTVVLTHAHLDHVGYLPRLVAGGFRGRVFSTAGTRDLAKLVLADAGRLQEEDARQANKHHYTKHEPALPLFTETDAYAALQRFQPVGLHRPMPVAPGVEVEFIDAGHLLGSAFVRMSFPDEGHPGILFGGDLGRYNRPVLPDPSPVKGAEILLVESTYGDRDHADDRDGEALAATIRETVARGGKIIIPAFAIGRVEEVLYWIKRFEDERRIPVVPVYVDSPMAVEALAFYSHRLQELDAELKPARKDLSAFATRRFQEVNSPQQSKDVTRSKAPSIVVSSSGMATGGRVLHHLKNALPDARHAVVFVGFQAEGTRGRQLVDGAQTVKIHGQIVPVNAKIQRIDSMSAHADRGEMLRWLSNFERPPRTTFLVHGEPGPMASLAARIEQQLGWHVELPDYLQEVAL